MPSRFDPDTGRPMWFHDEPDFLDYYYRGLVELQDFLADTASRDNARPRPYDWGNE